MAEDTRTVEEQILDILNRGNFVAEWPDDEAAAYRDNDGFQAGMDAVMGIRVQKILALAAQSLPANPTRE